MSDDKNQSLDIPLFHLKQLDLRSKTLPCTSHRVTLNIEGIRFQFALMEIELMRLQYKIAALKRVSTD